MKINHPLMHNNISQQDLKVVRKYLLKKNIILTQLKKVIELN